MPDDSEAPRPSRPRRERPLVAPGREAKTPPLPPKDAPPIWETLAPPSGEPLGASQPFFTQFPERDDHVTVTFGAPAPQRRVTVAFRILIAIPHFAKMFFVQIGVFFVAIVAWFAALFTGRVPDDIHGFLTRATQYQAQIYAYSLFLLTDKQPPWNMRSDEHPITIRTSVTKLNRAAVFFRVILLVPVQIVMTLLMIGVQAVSPVTWILTLVTGRIPEPLFGANAAALRYVTRAQAYTLMLTGEYPAGLKSDPPAPASAAPLPGDDALPVDLPTQPRFSRLVLGKGARRMVVLYIVLGALSYGGIFISGAITGFGSFSAYGELDDSYEELQASIESFATASQTCAISAGIDQLECLHQADVVLATAYTQFADEAETIDEIQVDEVIELARDCAAALQEMSTTESAASYNEALKDYVSSSRDFEDEYYYASPFGG